MESFCRHYHGVKFHALLCDPPYHLLSVRHDSPRQPGTGPYGRHTVDTKGFMGKEWDGGDVAFDPETWAALAEHLYDGAFGMAFASSRGWHRLACAIEDAGLIIHPSIFGWAYGSGFPKATRIDTQVDKAAGAGRKVIGRYAPPNGREWNLTQERQRDETEILNVLPKRDLNLYAPATDLAKMWAGHRYGLQAMKPALEPIIVFQKPYKGKPVENITETGAGALNVDGARIGWDAAGIAGDQARRKLPRTDITDGSFHASGGKNGNYNGDSSSPAGRWPANLVLCHSPKCEHIGTRDVKANPSSAYWVTAGHNALPGDQSIKSSAGHADADGNETVAAWECAEGCPVAALDEQSGILTSGRFPGHRNLPKTKNAYGKFTLRDEQERELNSGYASRFYFQADWAYEIAERLLDAEPVMYCAKASRKERDAGLETFDAVEPTYRTNGLVDDRTWIDRKDGKGRVAVNARMQPRHNPHPTVKPIALAKWLATLLLPPAEYAPRRILVPFAGSGSEMIGAGLAGWDVIVGIEQDAATVEIARARLAHWLAQKQLVTLT